MKRTTRVFLWLFVAGGFVNQVFAQPEETVMEYGEDSKRQEGVPRGEITHLTWESKIFESTTRDYWIYVPAQYDSTKPAALMIFQDGHAYVSEDGEFRVPVVLDNLIHKKKIPVTIGVFINPGHKGAAPPETPWRSDNRSYEYDNLTDEYARFLIDEFLPHISQSYNLTDDRKMRAICGISSGGICAFTAAWQRPDYFHKVVSHVGSFTNIRGGHVYPSLIRSWAKRDIKVFLQSGTNDLNLTFGNWWLSNLQMESALEFRSYDYKFVGGTGGHNGKHGGAILPETLEWLWSAEAASN